MIHKEENLAEALDRIGIGFIHGLLKKEQPLLS
jgi:hypothetical protein